MLKFITNTLRERVENQYDQGARKHTLMIMIAHERQPKDIQSEVQQLKAKNKKVDYQGRLKNTKTTTTT